MRENVSGGSGQHDIILAEMNRTTMKIGTLERFTAKEKDKGKLGLKCEEKKVRSNERTTQ